MKQCVFICDNQQSLRTTVIEMVYKSYCDYINRPQNWYKDRIRLMYNLLVEANVVLSEEDGYFEYRFWNTFWGVNEEGIGQNVLGRILMHIRYERQTGICAPYCRRFV